MSRVLTYAVSCRGVMWNSKRVKSKTAFSGVGDSQTNGRAGNLVQER